MHLIIGNNVKGYKPATENYQQIRLLGLHADIDDNGQEKSLTLDKED